MSDIGVSTPLTLHPLPGTTIVAAETLVDGDSFSADGGRSWYVVAVNASFMGHIAVYQRPHRRRTDSSPTIRVYVDHHRTLLLKRDDTSNAR